MYKFFGEIWRVGINVRECREVKIWEMSEGNGHRNEKHDPSLGQCSVG